MYSSLRALRNFWRFGLPELMEILNNAICGAYQGKFWTCVTTGVGGPVSWRSGRVKWWHLKSKMLCKIRVMILCYVQITIQVMNT